MCLLALCPPPLVPQVTLLGVTERKEICCNPEVCSSVHFFWAALDNANCVFAGEDGGEKGEVLRRSIT